LPSPPVCRHEAVYEKRGGPGEGFLGILAVLGDVLVIIRQGVRIVVVVRVQKSGPKVGQVVDDLFGLLEVFLRVGPGVVVDQTKNVYNLLRLELCGV
jgi:hypothetical protein